MSRVVKISEAVSLALHGMVLLSARPDEYLTVSRIADVLKVSPAHLHKVFQRLTRVGLLSANRGPKGGYTLAKPSDEITLLEIYETIEGPLSVNNCLFDTPVCKGKKCIFGNLLETTQKRYQAYLGGMKLSRLTDVYK
jgi:Rrf2 family nitric oxide-sensitive transcriptional repressor